MQDIFTQLCDPEQGILDVVGIWPKEKGTPDFHYYQAAVKMPGFDKNQNNIVLTAGASTDQDRALNKAIGEAIERYSGVQSEKDQTLLACYNALSQTAVHPKQFALYSPQQYRQPTFPFKNFEADTITSWSKAQDAKTRQDTWVPSCMVYVPYTFLISKGEVPIMQPISTGMAAHRSFEQAALNGILEVIERDAVSITWQARMSRPRLDLRSIGQELSQLIKNFERVGYHVQILEARNDLPVAVFIGVMRSSHPGMVPLTLSAACHLDKEVALTKCLEELALMERALKASLHSNDPGPWPDFDQLRNFQDHIDLWVRPEFAHHADFLVENHQEIAFDQIDSWTWKDPKQDLELLVDMVDRIGYRVLLKNLTPANMARLGYQTVKAVIPGFHPIASGHLLRATGGDRLWSLPQKLGYRGIRKSEGDNPIPCPFT